MNILRNFFSEYFFFWTNLLLKRPEAKLFLCGCLLCFVQSCNHEDSSNSAGKTDFVESTELKNYETLVDLEENKLATPVIIRHGSDSTFFVYDVRQQQVLKMDKKGTIINKIGRTGRGPGEYLFVNNMFVREQHLYIIDIVQFMIHKYDMEGNFVSSFNFGEIAGQPTIPPPGIGLVTANEIDNQPYVNLQGDIILSNVNVGDKSEHIFQIIDWEKKKQLSELGEVPEGSSFVLDNQKLRNEATDGKVPSFYKPNSFPVQDRDNPNEYFVIYSSLSQIAKYAANGGKLWEKNINTTETNSIRTRFFDAMDRMSNSPDIRDRVGLEYYSSGFSNNEGDLYLVVNTSPVMIHQYNNAGKLLHKYKFSSKNITPVLDIDFANSRILAASEKGEIRAYPF
ncbi:6-bladed beta-propeller [Fodinibius halophilus]|uniref:6-bladed beta-propeller n=1 Tax=Fodinibius halophilus TaxID=1736908 RepID=A0A6M1TF22_9BACT|nr:6-bladed beta-propeller [Fodinibius halophilus]NGP89374.1 6-bladed beta-propeller [Fodinibius halophilus]